jgi:hypothetical protein
MWRQGDILIQEITEIPPTAERRKSLVLASGDTTGHSHRIERNRMARVFSNHDGDDELFLEVIAEEAKVVHPEHEPIILPRGRYRVWRQREWDGDRGRNVRD